MATVVKLVRPLTSLSIAPTFHRHLSSAASAAIKSPDFEKEAFKGMSSHFPCLQKLEGKANEALNHSATGTIKGMYGENLHGHELYNYPNTFTFKLGGVLPNLEIAYETWGELNEDRSNAVIVHTGLSGSSHAKSSKKNSSKGWWEKMIGPGAPINTDHFFVICSNVIAGCYGSSGPCSINPLTGEAYGSSFPLTTVEDFVRAQFYLLDHFNINKVHACIGASLGGMQASTAAALYPDRVDRIICISSCVQSHPSSIALRYIQRRVIMADPGWNGGHYYGKSFPVMGMQHARELGTVSYRSGPEWAERFGNKRAFPNKTPDFCPDYLIETYLEKQGEKFCTSYDPNSLLYISKAMDMFDMGEGCGSLVEGVSRIKCPILVLGVVSDVLFPVQQQREMVELLQQSGNEQVTYYELNSKYGHDTFLLDINNVGAAIKGHLHR